ncbi:MAG: class C sortase, partial [Clostridium perfringens]|nr:class C sortase [Clostridium perfringens]
MSKKNNKLSLIFSFLIFFIGASIFFYPTISDLWNKHVNNQLEVKYSEKISKENTIEKDRILNKAIEYNKQHLVNMVKDLFSNNEYSKDNLYYSLLNPNNDGVMGAQVAIV